MGRYGYSTAANALSAAATVLIAWYVISPMVYLADLKALWAILPWFTWYQSYWQRQEFILNEGYTVPAAALSLVAFFALRRLIGLILPSWKVPRRKLIHDLPGALGRAVLAAIMIAALGGAWYAWQVHSYTFRQPPSLFGARLLKKNCAFCHNPYRPFHYIKAPDQWQVTVDRMRNLEGARVSGGDAKKIVRYIRQKISYSDAYLFRAKCLKCHGRERIEGTKRTAEEWAMVVSRMERLSPYAYRSHWRTQLERYLAEHVAAPVTDDSTRKKLETKIRFEKVCGTCHQLRLAINTREGEDIPGMIRRMEEKSPDLFEGVNKEDLALYVSSLPKDERAFSGLFPHDVRVEAAW